MGVRELGVGGERSFGSQQYVTAEGPKTFAELWTMGPKVFGHSMRLGVAHADHYELSWTIRTPAGEFEIVESAFGYLACDGLRSDLEREPLGDGWARDRQGAVALVEAEVLRFQENLVRFVAGHLPLPRPKSARQIEIERHEAEMMAMVRQHLGEDSNG